MSSSRPPAGDRPSEGNLPESFSSDDETWPSEFFDWNRRPPASDRPRETKRRHKVDWNSRSGSSDRWSVAKLSDSVVDRYNRGQPKEREKHTEPLHLQQLGCLKLVKEDTTPPSLEEKISSCPKDTTPASSDERTPICPEDRTPASSEERISSCPEDTTPICPGDTAPICPEDRTPASSEERISSCPEDTTPICPGDTTPICPEERIPICPADTTPCPICIHGRHCMSSCPYLRRVPDDVTNIGKGYTICCQVCSMYNNQCGHNMAYATPIFCFVCRSNEHFSRDCPEFKDIKS